MTHAFSAYIAQKKLAVPIDNGSPALAEALTDRFIRPPKEIGRATRDQHSRES
jgi:hypothetical protein